MAKADPTHNVRHAIQVLLPERPASPGNRRLVRFLALALISLLVVILALTLLSAIGAPKDYGVGAAMIWMAFIAFGAPTAVIAGFRDREFNRATLRRWESDPRRLAMEQLGLDIAAGRISAGLSPSDVLALNEAAGDWRQSRDALDALTWVRGELAHARGLLRNRLDESMRNLLAESGAGHPLGPSPFLIERARELFVEVGAEANALARSQAPLLALNTDESLEALRDDLDLLRGLRALREESQGVASESIPVEGH
jgi:hypothetical protein